MKGVIAAVFASFCFFFCSYAQSAPTQTTIAENNIAKINESLAKIQFLTVGFRQSYKEGDTPQTQTGTAYFKQNEGVFIKYNEMPVSVLINKNTVTYFDSKLNQKSQIPTKDSAAKILTITPEINTKMFDIKSTQELDEAIMVELSPKGLKDEGNFKLYFSKNDLILRRVDIISVDGDSFRMDLFSHNFKPISQERFKAINIEKVKI